MKMQTSSPNEDTGIIVPSQPQGKGGAPALGAAMVCHQ